MAKIIPSTRRPNSQNASVVSVVTQCVTHPHNYEQANRPSEVAGASAGAEPKKMAHWIGHAIGCVTFADQPPAVAVLKVMVTPVVSRMLSAFTLVVYVELS